MTKKIFLIFLFLTKNIISNNKIEYEDLTLEEKIAQVFVIACYPNKTKNTIKKIKKYKPGGIIFLKKDYVENQIFKTNLFQKISKFPLLVTQDCEWGLTMRLNKDNTALRYPKNITLGAIKDQNLIYEVAYNIGLDCKAIGIDLNFAPVVDIYSNPYNPIINSRSFGDNKDLVAEKGLVFAHGLKKAGVLACAKHFPGHGDTCIDSHLEMPIINHKYQDIINSDIYPFKKLIKNKIDSIMVGHISFPDFDNSGKPASLSKKINNLIKKDLNFNGLIITDALDMKALKSSFKGELELKAFLAGNDILLCPQNIKHAIKLIKNEILKNPNLEKQLNITVEKILAIKKNKKNSIYSNEIVNFLQRDSAKKIRDQAFYQAITMHKNENNIVINKNLLKECCIIQPQKINDNIFLNEISKYCKEVVTDNKFDNIKSYTLILVINKEIIKNQKLNQIFDLQDKKIILVNFDLPILNDGFPKAKNIINCYEDCNEMQSAAANFFLKS